MVGQGIVYDRALEREFDEDYEPAYADKSDSEGTFHPSLGYRSGDIKTFIEKWQENDDCRHPNPLHPGRITIQQVKEKFGGLRFYYSGGSKRFRSFTNGMEAHSFSVCHRCGDPGKLRADLGWHQTLCSNCYKEYVFNNAATLARAGEGSGANPRQARLSVENHGFTLEHFVDWCWLNDLEAYQALKSEGENEDD